MAAVHDCSFTLLHHAPYSPDLAPSNFILLPNMKKHLAKRHYRSEKEVIAAVEEISGTKLRDSIQKGSKRGSMWTEGETMLKKSVLAIANNRIMV